MRLGRLIGMCLAVCLCARAYGELVRTHVCPHLFGSLPQSPARAQARVKRQAQAASADSDASAAAAKSLLQGVAVVEPAMSQVVDAKRAVTSVSLTADGSVAATGSWSTHVALWDASTGRQLAALRGHTERVHSVAWRAGSVARVVSSSDAEEDMGDHDGRIAQRVTVQAEAAKPEWQLSSGAVLASCGADSMVMLWNDQVLQSAAAAAMIAQGGAPLIAPAARLAGHAARVNRVAWHPAGRWIASTSHDAHWKLWDAETASCLLTQSVCANDLCAYLMPCSQAHPDSPLHAPPPSSRRVTLTQHMAPPSTLMARCLPLPT